MQFKVLSWNIWGGQHLPEIVSFLRSANADIVGLQEVVQDLDGNKNTAEIIAKELGYEYIYFNTYNVETAKYYELLEPKTVGTGNAILSKYKISEYKTFELSEKKKRMAVEALIPVNGRNLRIFCTHLVHTHHKPAESEEGRAEDIRTTEIQNLQAKNLAELIPEENAFLMGDFNSTPDSESIKIISGVMENVDKAPFAPTWSVYPKGCPKCNPYAPEIRLDYIFKTKDLKTSSFKVGDSKGSDHLPVSVMVEI